jgi:phosphotransferase system enzyme I (PtsI)
VARKGTSGAGRKVAKKPAAAKATSRRTRPARRTAEQVFEGLAVSPGVAIGPAYIRESGDIQVPEYEIAESQVPAEHERFDVAVAKAARQLGKLKAKASSLHGAAAEELGYLLEAHSQMVESSRLLNGVRQRIERDLINAEAAVKAEIAAIAENFAAMDDAYLRARALEIGEVGMRIVRKLVQRDYRGFSALEVGSIVVAEEITPADTALMDPQRIGGFASVLGGAEGHTAIMARSLGPAAHRRLRQRPWRCGGPHGDHGALVGPARRPRHRQSVKRGARRRHADRRRLQRPRLRQSDGQTHSRLQTPPGGAGTGSPRPRQA